MFHSSGPPSFLPKNDIPQWLLHPTYLSLPHIPICTPLAAQREVHVIDPSSGCFGDKAQQLLFVHDDELEEANSTRVALVSTPSLVPLVSSLSELRKPHYLPSFAKKKTVKNCATALMPLNYYQVATRSSQSCLAPLLVFSFKQTTEVQTQSVCTPSIATQAISRSSPVRRAPRD